MLIWENCRWVFDKKQTFSWSKSGKNVELQPFLKKILQGVPPGPYNLHLTSLLKKIISRSKFINQSSKQKTYILKNSLWTRRMQLWQHCYGNCLQKNWTSFALNPTICEKGQLLFKKRFRLIVFFWTRRKNMVICSESNLHKTWCFFAQNCKKHITKKYFVLK